MIYDSSRNYLDDWVTIVFDGTVPSDSEISDYCHRCYGFIPKSIFIEEPCEGFGGFPNPGIIKCSEREGQFE